MLMIRNPLPRTLKQAAALCAIAAALTGCGHPVQETAAHKIADALPSLLGPAAHYDVQVDGDLFALSRGRARAVHLQGEEVQLSPTLTLDTLNADVNDVSFDRDTRRLTHVGLAQFTATLDQTHFLSYFSRAKSRYPGLVITLRSDDVQAQVPVTFMGLQTTASLSGTFAPDAAEPSRLDFIANGGRVGVVPLPAVLLNLALDEVNPVINLSGLRVPLTLKSASVANNRLTLTGLANLEGLIRPE